MYCTELHRRSYGRPCRASQWRHCIQYAPFPPALASVECSSLDGESYPMSAPLPTLFYTALPVSSVLASPFPVSPPAVSPSSQVATKTEQQIAPRTWSAPLPRLSIEARGSEQAADLCILLAVVCSKQSADSDPHPRFLCTHLPERHCLDSRVPPPSTNVSRHHRPALSAATMTISALDSGTSTARC
jgi:hypothetical protein